MSDGPPAGVSVASAREPEGSKTRERALLALICLVAAGARLSTQLLHPSLVYADEVFQYLEPAHRLLTGAGLVPWEYVVGARSWLIPVALAGVLGLGRLASAAPAAQLACATLFMTALAVAGVAAAFQLGRRAGLLHAGLAGLVSAVWCELVYFSPHVLADTLSADTLILAFAVAGPPRDTTRARLFWAGLLFGLTAVLRIQLAPAVAVALLGLALQGPRRRALILALGAFVPVLVLGISDAVALGAPFHSLWAYVLTNRAGVADSFGRMPPGYYALMELVIWGGFTPFVLLTAGLGARRLPLMAAVAAVIVTTFTLVGHKEPRFVYPALPLVFALCGVGSADLLVAVARRTAAGDERRRRRHLRLLAGGTALVWAAVSLAAAAREPMRARWSQESGTLRAFALIDADPRACGVGVSPSALWWRTGRVLARDDLRLYGTPPDGTPPHGTPVGRDAGSDAYDYLLALDVRATPPPPAEGYSRIACFDDVCVSRRAGACRAAAACELAAPPPVPVRAAIERLGLVTAAQEARLRWKPAPGCAAPASASPRPAPLVSAPKAP